MLILYRKNADTIEGFNTDAIATLTYQPERQSAHYEDEDDIPEMKVLPARLTIQLNTTESSIESGYDGSFIGIRQDPIEIRLLGTAAVELYARLRDFTSTHRIDV